MSKPRSRGTTLPELLVATTLLFVLTGAIYLCVQVSRTNEDHMDERKKALRACLVGMEHIRGQLENGTVLNPLVGTSAGQLDFLAPEYDAGGRIVLGPMGDIAWSSTPSSIFLRAHELILSGASGERSLAQLGQAGQSPTFSVDRPEETLLEVKLTSTYSTGYQLSRVFQLSNQF